MEYTPERGSAIDPHFDDFWLWGERLLTLNLLTNTTLTFSTNDGGVANPETRSKLSIEVPLAPRYTANVCASSRSNMIPTNHRRLHLRASFSRCSWLYNSTQSSQYCRCHVSAAYPNAIFTIL
eukprot:Platyproteum_vivax@DN7459_c0_g1_i10.p1